MMEKPAHLTEHPSERQLHPDEQEPMPFTYGVSNNDLLTPRDPRVRIDASSGCWMWLGGVTGSGYGATKYGNTGAYSVHRLAWERQHGDIPPGMHIDHICRVRLCINPNHLRVVTPKQNVLENSVGITARNARLTACPKCGGGFSVRYSTKEVRSDGTPREYRICRPCDAKRGRVKRAAKKAGCFPNA